MNKDQVYQQILTTSELPIFLLPKWMDIVAPDWELAISIDKEGRVNGLLPYQKKSKWGLKACVTPWLTPHSGPWIRLDDTTRNSKSIGQHQAITNTLITQLPKSHRYQFKLRPTPFPAHPWHWKGFDLRTRYTYQLTLKSAGNLFNNFKNTIRTDIRKSEKYINVLEIDDASEWQAFVDKNRAKHYGAMSDNMANKLFHLEQSFCLKAVANNEIIGAAYFIKTMSKIYYLVGIRNEHNQNLATTAMLWYVINKYSEQGLTLDFEGSMLPSVEPYFRRFGGDPISYLQVNKQPKWLQLLY